MLVSCWVLFHREPGKLSCVNQTRNGTLSPFWEWTGNAIYEGTVTIREMEYDRYSYAVSQASD